MKQSCTEWMQKVSQLLQNSVKLLDCIHSPEQLITAELKVWEQLQIKGNDNHIWSSVCSLLLPENFQDLWSSIFHQLFFTQSKNIVIEQFKSISITDKINDTLKNLENNENNINTGNYIWDYIEDESLESIKQKANGIPKSMNEIINLLDEQLQNCTNQLNHLLVDNTKKFKKSSSFAITKQTTIKELKDFIQSQCFDTLNQTLKTISTLNKDILNTIKSEKDIDETKKEQILFLSRLCGSISENSQQIPKMLPATAITNIPEGSRFSKSYSYFSLKPKFVNNPLREKLSRQCRLEYLKGYLWWSIEQSSILSNGLKNSIELENWHDSALRKSSWSSIEVKMKQETTEQIKIPSYPSSFVSQFLFDGCKSFHGQTAHTADTITIRFMAQLLTLRVISIYENFIKSNISDSIDKKISREGLVQMLFDIKYILDVLSGAYQQQEEWPELVKEVYPIIPKDNEISLDGNLKSQITTFLSFVKKQFEPIDLAFYEPRIQSFVQKSYLQSTVSLGYFINTNRLYNQS